MVLLEEGDTAYSANNFLSSTKIRSTSLTWFIAKSDMSEETRECQNCKQSFTVDEADFRFYEKIKVPPPTFCPECREIRRIAFRNERALYKRKCDLCGREVVARVSPDKPYPMYCKECWWSDNWDSLSYGREYDFSRPFFEQFKELLNSVPHISLFSTNTVNSDWVNQETDDRNCYLNVGGHYNEDSGYNTYELYGKNSFDNFWIFRSEFGYSNINCERCYRISFSRECSDCIDTFFSADCRNCTNIIGCAGLRNKQHYIFNKPYTKESYQGFLKQHPLSSRGAVRELQQQAEAVRLAKPHRFAYIIQSINASGHFITQSRNVRNCWNAEKVEDSKNLYIAAEVKDCYDATSQGASELTYECASGGGFRTSKFILYSMSGDPLKSIHSYDLEYGYGVVNSRNCFGCVAVRNKEYCILNTQYSKTDYAQLTSNMKQHMNDMPYTDKKGRIYKYGEFFPTELSPFGYNETVAQEYYPLTREGALEKGYQWSDYESGTKYEFSDYEIPDDIRDVKNDILEKVLKCEVSGKAYRIISMELEFYRTMGLPIPRRAPLQRHKDRMAKLLPRKSWKRQCQCAGAKSDNGVYTNTATHRHGHNHCIVEFETPYVPKRLEMVYCEQCYQSEVI